MRKTNLLHSTLLALTLGTTLSGCAVVSKQETAGEYIDDAGITAQVKADIIAEPSLTALQIHVETLKRVVQLSGFVDSAEKKATAERIARNVKGVLHVKNNLVVKK